MGRHRFAGILGVERRDSHTYYTSVMYPYASCECGETFLLTGYDPRRDEWPTGMTLEARSLLSLHFEEVRTNALADIAESFRRMNGGSND